MRPGSYTWVHNRPPHNRPPPPRRNQNNFGMNDVLEMLGEVDLSGGEFYSIMRDMDIFEGMDPFEMMAIADSLAGGSAPCMGPFDSNDEGDDEFDLFQMAALSEALADGVDDFGPDDFYDEMDPMDAALLSMMMHSHMEEDDEDEEYSDEQY